MSLIYLLQSKNLVVQANYWSQVLLMNEYQRLSICENLIKCISTQNVAIFGLSFKGNINDVRSANSIFLSNYLTYHNLNINLYDPLVEFKDFLNEIKLSSENFLESNHLINIEKLVTFYNDYKECLKGCNTVIFCNDHSIFKKEFNLNNLYEILEKPAYIFDCYDNYSIEDLKETQFKIFKLGEYTDCFTNKEV